MSPAAIDLRLDALAYLRAHWAWTRAGRPHEGPSWEAIAGPFERVLARIDPWRAYAVDTGPAGVWVLWYNHGTRDLACRPLSLLDPDAPAP